MGLDEGKIIINNKEIYNGMDSECFKKLFFIDINSYKNGNIERYSFKSPQEIAGLSLWIKITFRDTFISSIELKNADGNLKNSYDNWSNDRMKLRRKSHDEWLINNLGKPYQKSPSALKYSYTWGTIESYQDLKSGDNGIVIMYSRNGKVSSN